MKKKEITIQLDSGLESIMGMMTLGLVTGEEVTVTANGEDEQQAMEQIEAYLTRKS